MNKFTKFALLIPGMIAISVLSCKKGKDEPIVEPPVASGAAIIAGTKSCVLTKVTDASDYITFEYDAKSRPIKENFFTNGIADDYLKITYNATDIVVEFYNKSNVKLESNTYKLGSNGYISNISGTYTYTNGGYNYTETSTNTLTQNADGYLIKLTTTDVSTSNKPGYITQTTNGTSTYTYSSGNLVSLQEQYGSQTYTTTYDYYTDKPNNLPGYDDEILNFLFGKRNTNLGKKRTEIIGGSTSIENYTYTFSPEGLVSKQTVSGSASYNRGFEYSCK